MQEVDLRVRIPDSLHRRFKVICIKKKLSLPKQTAELIRKFVEIRESEERLEYECSKKNNE